MFRRFWIVMMFLVPFNAYSQTPLPPTPAENAGRLTSAEQVITAQGATLAEIQKSLVSLRGARAALGKRTADNATEIDALTARITALESAGEAGCAGFRNADPGRLQSVQIACIRMLEGATSGTDQLLISTFQGILLNIRVKSRTIDGSGDSRTEKVEYVVTDNSDPRSLCDESEVEVVRTVGATPQSPGSVTRLRCTPKVVPYVPTGSPIRTRRGDPAPVSVIVRQPRSTATEWIAAVLVSGALGGGAGCGIGGLAMPEEISEDGFSKSGCGYGALIGIGGGAAIGAVAMAIIHASRPDPDAPAPAVSFGLLPTPGGVSATLGAGF